MRAGSAIALLVAGAIGWLIGSRYPAPEAWIAAIAAQADRIGIGARPDASSPETDDAQAIEAAGSGSGGGDEDAGLDQLRAWIGEARRKHPYADSADRMYAVMMCESNGQAKVVNPAGPYYGLFQYSRQTWNADWNAYRNEDILDPKAQIFATALAWQRGMQGQWGCYKRAH